MRAFNFKAGTASWDSGTLLHWYAEVDWNDPRHAALANLVANSNQTLLDAGFPISPVEPAWLHITIDQVSVPAHLITPDDRTKLIAEVSSRMADIAPITITIGSLLSYHSGVIADLHPDDGLARLHAAARDGIRAALGEDACRYAWSLQHLTTAYAYADADSDAAQRLLRRIRPGHAPLHIKDISLVDVTATSNDRSKSITWKRLHTIPLRGKD